jgi:hypothetical protein
MSECSLTKSKESQHWPEGTISVKLTMNAYLLAMAFEHAMNQGMKLWEFINIALWERLGKPDEDALLEYAANIEIDEEDPKWKKRLKITARHEIEMKKLKEQRATGGEASSGTNGE